MAANRPMAVGKQVTRQQRPASGVLVLILDQGHGDCGVTISRVLAGRGASMLRHRAHMRRWSAMAQRRRALHSLTLDHARLIQTE